MHTGDLGGGRWRKSSRSGGAGGDDNCIEVAFVGLGTAVRDSKNSGGPVLVFPASSWRRLVNNLSG